MWLEATDAFVPSGALVIIDPALPSPNSPEQALDTVRLLTPLKRAALVIAPDSWKTILARPERLAQVRGS